MKVFRTSPPRWATTIADLFGGDGAAAHPGRWNYEGEHTTYCAETPDVALAEAGFYEIIFNLLQRRRGGIVAPRKYNDLLNRSRVLAVAEFKNLDAHLVDISTPKEFDAQCRHHNIPLTFGESRNSDYTLLTDRTRRLAHAIRRTGAAGVITRSARSEGRCVAIFPKQAPSDSALEITEKTTLNLSASSSGGLWDGRKVGEISESEIHAAYSLSGAKTKVIVRVLSLS